MVFSPIQSSYSEDGSQIKKVSAGFFISLRYNRILSIYTKSLGHTRWVNI